MRLKCVSPVNNALATLQTKGLSCDCSTTVCAEKIAFTRAANNLGMTSHRLRGGLTLKHFEKG